MELRCRAVLHCRSSPPDYPQTSTARIGDAGLPGRFKACPCPVSRMYWRRVDGGRRPDEVLKEMQPAPVAVFLYNRIEAARQILDSVSRARAPRIYLFVDGPKNDPDDIRRCREVRGAVESTTFQCDVRAQFSTVNMGSRARILSGIETVFAAEQAAIFVEDDCILAPEFFAYTGNLLERYRDTPRVMMISGTNPLGRWRRDGADYLFSKLGSSHAWAS